MITLILLISMVKTIVKGKFIANPSSTLWNCIKLVLLFLFAYWDFQIISDFTDMDVFLKLINDEINIAHKAWFMFNGFVLIVTLIVLGIISHEKLSSFLDKADNEYEKTK